MCTVQLPLSVTAAYVMRRVNRSQNRRSPASEVVGPESVRRALFSEAVDHNLTARDLSTAFAEMQKEATRRWNFDFSTDTPLQGRFEWYPVGSASTVDESSAITPQTTIDESSTVSSQTTIDESSVVSTQSKMFEIQSKQFSKSGKTAISEENLKRPIQRKLTDFMSQRKRTSSMMAAKSPVSITKNKVRKTLAIASTTTTQSSTR